MRPASGLSGTKRHFEVSAYKRPTIRTMQSRKPARVAPTSSRLFRARLKTHTHTYTPPDCRGRDGYTKDPQNTSRRVMVFVLLSQFRLPDEQTQKEKNKQEGSRTTSFCREKMWGLVTDGGGGGGKRGCWWVELLKDTFECDIVAFQRLLFRQSERELQTREDEGACNPKG